MSNDYGGWIKLHRKLLDSEVFKNEKLLKVWVWCLLKATREDRGLLVGVQAVKLAKGSFVFGREKAASELKMSIQTVRTCLANLQILGNLTIEATNKFSIITLTKWDEYQSRPEEVTNRSTSKQPASQPTSHHKQEAKEVKNIRSSKFLRTREYCMTCQIDPCRCGV